MLRSVLAFVRTQGKEGMVPPVQFYRAWLPMKALKRYSSKFDVEIYTQRQLAEVFSMTGNKLEDGLIGRDIYVMARMYHDSGDGVDESIEALHEGGGKVVFDTDDDLTGEHRQFGGETGFIKTMSSADIVTTSTKYLADRMAKYTRMPPIVLPNHLDTKWFGEVSAQTKKHWSGLTVGFVETTTHTNDWGYPVEALIRLSKEHNITVMAAGYVPPALKVIPDLKTIKPVPYANYPAMMRQFDIVCCSLDPDDQFNKSKSSIKSLEAMSARRMENGRMIGAVPVCTDMLVYNSVVKNGKTGLLVDNNDWYGALKELITNRDRRLRIGQAGLKFVRKYYDIRRGYRLWERAYSRI